jgi:hypothetical protein
MLLSGPGRFAGHVGVRESSIASTFEGWASWLRRQVKEGKVVAVSSMMTSMSKTSEVGEKIVRLIFIFIGVYAGTCYEITVSRYV